MLGRVVAHCWTVEFQKRGLPHARILLVMHPDDKPVTPTAVGQVVSAELPDDSDPEQAELIKTVATLLLHGPCGPLAPNKPCMNEQGVCSKGFPKDCSPATTLPPDQYALYRKRDGDRRVGN